MNDQTKTPRPMPEPCDLKSFRTYEHIRNEESKLRVRCTLLKEGYDLVPMGEKMIAHDSFFSGGTSWILSDSNVGHHISSGTCIVRRPLGSEGRPDIYAGRRILSQLLGVE